MDIARGALAKIDRQLLAGMEHDQASRMVRVPVSDAMWPLGSATASPWASPWDVASPNSSHMNSSSQLQPRISPVPSPMKSNPVSCTDLKNSTAERNASTNENGTYAGRRRFSGRGPCHTGRRAPSQVATTAVHVGQASSTSDATAPSAPDP